MTSDKKPPEAAQMMFHVRLRGVRAHEEDDGSTTLEVPGRPLTRYDQELLENLFPDLRGAVEVLIVKQALLNAVRM